MKSNHFILFLSVLILSSTGFSETHVSGVVSGIWNREGSPYILDSTIVIQQGTSLLIDSGVTVRIGAQDSIKVYGTFKALGAETDSVFFLPAEGDSTWKLIYFYPESDDDNRFLYCHFEESGGYLIKSLDCCQEYSHCTFISHEYSLHFDNNDGGVIQCVFITDTWALVASWGSNMLIDGNDFTGSGCGINGYSASGTITNNVMNNDNMFMQVIAMSNMEIIGNICGGWFYLEGSNIIISGNNIGGRVDINGSNLTISNNQIEGQFCCIFGGTEIEILNNNFNYVGMGSGLHLCSINDLIVQNNQILEGIQTDGCTEFTCRDNVFHDASFSMGDCEIIKNTLVNGSINFGGGCNAQVDSNYIEGDLYVGEETLVEARHNEMLWLSGDYADEMVWVQGTLILENNTIVSKSYSTFTTYLVYIEDTGDLTMTNNILVGDSVNSVGLKVESGGIVDHSYNCFWKCDTIYVGCQAGIGELYANPYLIGGNPFNAGLQAVSPCIDTGNPSLPNDPDGTRADMGFQFFDTRYDHPPTVCSDTTAIATLNSAFEYWAKASDDGDFINFTFENLPEWLNSLLTLTVLDSVLLSGSVPLEQEDFDFMIRAEDSAGQLDSQWVSVEALPYTVIYGVLTGVLGVENSPYLMVEDVIVPEGESLTIEPGVEIRVRRSPEPDGRYAIKVYGQILAEGTAEDTIVFGSAEEEPEWDWEGINLIKCNNDTSIISYSIIEYCYIGGVQTDSSSTFVIHDNSIKNNLYGLMFSNHSTGKILSNYFWENEWGSIICYASSPEVFQNAFMDSSSSSIRLDSSSCYIHDNQFHSNNAIDINFNSNPLIEWNIFTGTEPYSRAFTIVNGSEPNIVNNMIWQCTDGILIYNNANPIIYNNIIINCTNAGIIQNFYISPADSFNIKFNNIWNNAGGNFVDCPDYLGVPAMVNANGDSCDIFFNICENPMLEGGNPFSFVLMDGSPCIDAGDPDSVYYDVEDPSNPGFALYPAKGTIINDMGRYGGHGTSFWSGIFSRKTDPVLSEFILWQNYPNPFNTTTRIKFYIPANSNVRLIIYNILGEEVVRLCDDFITSGEYSYVWNASDLSSGIYFACLKAGEFQRVKTMILLK